LARPQIGRGITGTFEEALTAGGKGLQNRCRLFGRVSGGSPWFARQFDIEQARSAAASGFVTGKRRGKCHRKQCRFRVCSEWPIRGMFWTMSANDVLEQVKALPPRERRKFFECVHKLEATIDAQPNGQRKRRIRWPDAAARRRRIFGDKVVPNLVLLAREQERY
jgi:hypothetical protein